MKFFNTEYCIPARHAVRPSLTFKFTGTCLKARKTAAYAIISTYKHELFAFKRLLHRPIILTSPGNIKFHPHPVQDTRATCQWPYRLVKPWKQNIGKKMMSNRLRSSLGVSAISGVPNLFIPNMCWNHYHWYSSNEVGTWSETRCLLNKENTFIRLGHAWNHHTVMISHLLLVDKSNQYMQVLPQWCKYHPQSTENFVQETKRGFATNFSWHFNSGRPNAVASCLQPLPSLKLALKMCKLSKQYGKPKQWQMTR